MIETMNAEVISSDRRNLMVRDLRTNMEVRVIKRSPGRFTPGEHILITFNGAMTNSIPPQISAISIRRTEERIPAVPERRFPREIRAAVLQVRRGMLIVRDENGGRINVNYPYSHHFCAGQRIIIRHESIIMGNPIELNAADIIPVC